MTYYITIYIYIYPLIYDQPSSALAASCPMLTRSGAMGPDPGSFEPLEDTPTSE